MKNLAGGRAGKYGAVESAFEKGGDSAATERGSSLLTHGATVAGLDSFTSRRPATMFALPPDDGIGEPARRQILVAVDLSDGTREALDYSFSIAQRNHMQVTVLHVVPDMDLELSAGSRNLLMTTVRKELDDLVPATTRNSFRTITKVELGFPYRTILRNLERIKPDLLVMNVHNQGMLERALLGSLAERLVLRVSCPVMLIPPAGAEVTGRAHPGGNAA